MGTCGRDAQEPHYHNTSEQTVSDAERTARLNELGYTELRFTNEEVLHDLDNVLKKITTHTKKRLGGNGN